MDAIWLTGAQWPTVLRMGLGLWRLESWRHKDRRSWFEGGGIRRAADVAAKHRWNAVRSGFEAVVVPRPRTMACLVWYAELALGLGLVLGFLTPVALVGALLLNVLHFALMIHDWAEQGQNSMMALIPLVALFGCRGSRGRWTARWGCSDAARHTGARRLHTGVLGRGSADARLASDPASDVNL